jgi:hypothetical protein
MKFDFYISKPYSSDILLGVHMRFFSPPGKPKKFKLNKKQTHFMSLKQTKKNQNFVSEILT